MATDRDTRLLGRGMGGPGDLAVCHRLLSQVRMADLIDTQSTVRVPGEAG